MPNWVSNHLKISAPNKGEIKSLDEAFPAFWNMRKTESEVDGTFVCDYYFDSKWMPPFEQYKKLKQLADEIKGVNLEANWTDEGDMWNTHYRWMFCCEKEMIVETGLNPMIAEFEKAKSNEGAFHSNVQDKISELETRRDEIDQTISGLRKYVLVDAFAKQPEPSSDNDIPF
jgi:hypothetical protein